MEKVLPFLADADQGQMRKDAEAKADAERAERAARKNRPQAPQQQPAQPTPAPTKTSESRNVSKDDERQLRELGQQIVKESNLSLDDMRQLGLAPPAASKPRTAPAPQASPEWKPEEPTLGERTFGIDSPGLLPKKQLWGEYQRLQDQVTKMQERSSKYKFPDPTMNRDLTDAKRELQEFIRTKGESFKKRNKSR
jgi:hypothetical protein